MGHCLDVLVVGAGISGIAFASIYLDIHPDAELVVLESEKVLGGTWNRRRLYDHFFTQFSHGFGEFSGYPMDVPPEEDQYCGLFKAKYTTNYLEEYAEKKVFNGTALRDRIRFSTTVVSAKQLNEGWTVQVQDVESPEISTLFTRRLVLASGITSIPHMPGLEGSATFSGRIIHQRDFGSSGVLSDPTVKRVTVLGGGKSGSDMVYACCKAGKDVSWIVRPSGTGPCTFVDAGGKAGFNNAFELGSTRAVEALQPSYFAALGWWNWLLHRTWFGQWFSSKLFASAHTEAVASADYAHRPSRGDFSQLIPHTPLFWRNNTAGIVNHADFYETIAGSAFSFYDEIKGLEGHNIHLKSGRCIHADVLLVGTGWQDSLGYLSSNLRAKLGLPYPLKAESGFNEQLLAASREWYQLEKKADTAITSKFPALARPPEHYRTPITSAPYRLFNLVVPVDDPSRSVAVIGMIGTTNYFRTGEAQARWTTAYFDGKVDLPSVSERRTQVAQFVTWTRRRYLSSGNDGNSINFDTYRYTDRLYRELGLTTHLKPWFAYFFSPIKAEDYAGLNQEYRDRFGAETSLGRPS